jgi:hypothetical protein
MARNSLGYLEEERVFQQFVFIFNALNFIGHFLIQGGLLFFEGMDGSPGQFQPFLGLNNLVLDLLQQL